MTSSYLFVFVRQVIVITRQACEERTGKGEGMFYWCALDLPAYNTAENGIDFLKMMNSGERSGWSFECKIEKIL